MNNGAVGNRIVRAFRVGTPADLHTTGKHSLVSHIICFHDLQATDLPMRRSLRLLPL